MVLGEKRIAVVTEFYYIGKNSYVMVCIVWVDSFRL